MPKRSMSVLLGFALLAGPGASVAAAQVAEQKLTEPEATFPEGFAFVQRVRELTDGRVLVADPLGQVLLIVNLAAGTADTLGGVGQGPEEYRQPDAVWALPGDSTLLVVARSADASTPMRLVRNIWIPRTPSTARMIFRISSMRCVG